MTNKYNQQRLNRKKWVESEQQLRDMSGEMDYCEYCEHKIGVNCDCSEYERTSNCYCATADNRMKRKNKV